MKFLKEFKEFAVRGNVMDLAVGVVIGASFGKIVTSLVEDVIMPPISLLLGKVDFANKFWTLSEGEYPTLAAAKEAGAVTLNYGMFLNTVLQFLIVAFTIFLLIKQLNRFRRKQEKEQEKKPEEPRTERLLAEIRDILKKK